jgi:S-adenosylmethionine decarboxylase
MSHIHVLYDIWVEDQELLKYVEPIRAIVDIAAQKGGAHVYHEHWHQFQPFGVTGFLLLKESHISVHTWVEENFVAIDIFPSGPMSIEEMIAYLRQEFDPSRERIRDVGRGDNGEVEAPVPSEGFPVGDAVSRSGESA